MQEQARLRQSRLSIARLFAGVPVRVKQFNYVCAAAVVLLAGGCGENKKTETNQTTSSSTGSNTTTNGPVKVVETLSATTSDPLPDGICAESGGCTAYLYLTPEGGLFACQRLVVSVLSVITKLAPSSTDGATTAMMTTTTVTGDTTTAETTDVSATTTSSTDTTTVSETGEPRTVTRPGCASDSRRIPVTGININTVAGVEVSADGASAWTPRSVTLQGRLVNGVLVVNG